MSTNPPLTPKVAPEEFFGATPKDTYRQSARGIATQHGLNEDLFEKQINQESGFNPKARSGAGARGISQFMPATGRQYGLNTREDFNDPYRSMDAQARHMKDLLKANGGDEEKALAAYNAGQGRVDDGSYLRIKETRNYIKSIRGFVSDELKPKVSPDDFFKEQTTTQPSPQPATPPANQAESIVRDLTHNDLSSTPEPAGATTTARPSLGAKPGLRAGGDNRLATANRNLYAEGVGNATHPRAFGTQSQPAQRQVKPRVAPPAPRQGLNPDELTIGGYGYQVPANLTDTTGTAPQRPELLERVETALGGNTPSEKVLEKARQQTQALRYKKQIDALVADPVYIESLKALPDDQKYAKALEISKERPLHETEQEILGVKGLPGIQDLGTFLRGAGKAIGSKVKGVARVLGDEEGLIGRAGKKLYDVSNERQNLYGRRGGVGDFEEAAGQIVPDIAARVNPVGMGVSTALGAYGEGATTGEALGAGAKTAGMVALGGKLTEAVPEMASLPAEVRGATQYGGRVAANTAAPLAVDMATGAPITPGTLAHAAAFGALFGAMPHGEGQKGKSETGRVTTEQVEPKTESRDSSKSALPESLLARISALSPEQHGTYSDALAADRNWQVARGKAIESDLAKPEMVRLQEAEKQFAARYFAEEGINEQGIKQSSVQDRSSINPDAGAQDSIGSKPVAQPDERQLQRGDNRNPQAPTSIPPSNVQTLSPDTSVGASGKVKSVGEGQGGRQEIAPELAPVVKQPVTTDYPTYTALSPKAKAADFTARLASEQAGEPLTGQVYVDANYQPHYSPFPTNVESRNWSRVQKDFVPLGVEGESVMARLREHGMIPGRGESVDLNRVPEGTKQMESSVPVERRVSEGSAPNGVERRGEIISESPQTTKADILKEELRKVKEESAKDKLTGLQNQNQWEGAKKRIDADPNFHIARIDVNELKRVNDTISHEAGSEYIKQVGKIVGEEATKAGVSPRMTFRNGGDELTLAGNEQAVTAAARVIQERIADEVNLPDGTKGSVAVGTGLKEADADTAMYSNKKAMKAAKQARDEAGRWAQEVINESATEKPSVVTPVAGETGRTGTGGDGIGEPDTGIKNAVVEAERADRNLSMIEKAQPKAQAESMDAGKATVDNDPAFREKVKQWAKNPTSLDDEQVGALVYDRKRIQQEQRNLYSQLEKAYAEGDTASEIALKERLAKSEQEYSDNDKAGTHSGTLSGRYLAARKMMIKEDYSLAHLTQRAKVANDGREVPAETRAELERISKRVEELEGKLKDADERVAKVEADSALSRMQQEEKREARRTKRAATKAELDTEFADLVKQLRNEDKPKLPINPESGSATIDLEMVQILGKMAKNRVKAGVNSIEGIVDDVYNAVKDHIDGVTPRDVRDAITGYGKTAHPSKNEVDTQLRELKRQGRLLSALEDAQGGEAPKRTGFQREAPSQRVRELQKQVSEEMRAQGIKTVDPAKQLKTSLDGIKTRLKNSIQDIEKQLAEGKRTTDTRTQVEYDVEAKGLKVTRDALKRQLDETLPERGMTDEQRVKVAKRGLEKSIAELERKIRTGDIATKRRESKTPPSPELDALRTQRDALQADLKALQDTAKIPADPLKAYKKRLADRKAELEGILATKSFYTNDKGEPTTVKPRNKLVLDDEAASTRKEIEKLQRAADREINSLKKQGLLQTLNSIRQIGMVSSVSAFLNDFSSTAMNQPLEHVARYPTALADAARAIVSGKRVIANISPVEFSQLMAEGFVDAAKDFKNVIKTGETAHMQRTGDYSDPINTRSKKFNTVINSIPHFREWGDSLSFEGAYRVGEKVFTKVSELNEKRGHKPMTPEEVSEMATNFAEQLTFRQDNMVDQMLKKAVSDGDGRRFLVRQVLPFVKTMTNYVYQGYQYAGGGVPAALFRELRVGGRALKQGYKETGKAGEAIKAFGVNYRKVFTPADQIAQSQYLGRAITGQALLMPIGVAMFLRGYLTGAPDKPEKDRSKDDPPPFSVYNPLTKTWHDYRALGVAAIPIAEGALIGREWKRGQVDGMEAAKGVKALFSQAPMMRGVQQASDYMEPGKIPEAAGRYVASWVPFSGLVRSTAEATDKPRDTKGFMDEVKLLIPGLRRTIDPKKDKNGAEYPNQWQDFFDPSKTRRANSPTPPVVPIKKKRGSGGGVTLDL